MKSFMKYHAIIDFSEAQRESLKNSSNPRASGFALRSNQSRNSGDQSDIPEVVAKYHFYV